MGKTTISLAAVQAHRMIMKPSSKQNTDRLTPGKESKSKFRSGLVGITGKPNVGKSTLINALLGQKLSVVSCRPQTTRNEIKGILTEPDYQIVFLDTPGLIQPRDRFNEFLLEEALKALKDVDLLYHVVQLGDSAPLPPAAGDVLQSLSCKKFLVVNKIDCAKKLNEEKWISAEKISSDYDAFFRISALEKIGLKKLLEQTVACLPVHPPYYDEDYLTDRDMRFLSAEIVREKLFELTDQEVPYSIATNVEEFKERPGRKTYIRVHIFVERESQKGLIVGAEGRVLKKVGKSARADIEQLLGEPVFLELWVKVRKDWRKKEIELRRLGYAASPKKNIRKKR